jgi:hypothetical protein
VLEGSGWDGGPVLATEVLGRDGAQVKGSEARGATGGEMGLGSIGTDNFVALTLSRGALRLKVQRPSGDGPRALKGRAVDGRGTQP